MNRTIRAARRGRARLFARDIVARAGRWMVAGALLSAGLVLVDKGIGLPGAWWLWVGVPVAAAGVSAAVVEGMKRRSLLVAASEMDARLALKDRMGSALSLGAGQEDPFARLAVEESEAVAMSADLSRAVPIRFGSSWWAWPVIVAASVAGAIWMPESSLLRAGDARRIARAQEEQQRAAVHAEVVDAIHSVAATPVESPGPESPTADPLAARRLEALQKLEEELRTGKIDADRAREESARQLELAAQGLDERSHDSQLAADATRDRLASRAGDAENDESPLTRAVRHGDLREARQAAEELLRSKDTLSPEERERIARDMQRLADELAEKEPKTPKSEAVPEEREAGGGTPQAQGVETKPEVDPALRKDLNNQGLSDQQVDQVARQGKSGAAEKTLEEMGLPKEAARTLAKRLEEDAQRQRADKQAEQKTDELSRAMRDAAEALRNEDPGSKDSPKPSSGSDQTNKTGGAAAQRDQTAKETQPEQDRQNGGAGQEGASDQRRQDAQKPGGKPGEQGAGQPGNGQRSEQTGEKTTDGAKGDHQKTPGAAGGTQPEQGGKQGDRAGSTSRPERADGAPSDSKASPGAHGTTPGEKPGERDEGAPSDGKPQTAPGAATRPDGGGERSPEAGKTGRSEAAGKTPEGTLQETPAGGSDKQNPERSKEPGAGKEPRQDATPGSLPDLDQIPSPDSVEGRAIKKMIENLKNLESDREGAAKDRQLSRELRERAQRMLDNATPEQRRKIEQWQQEFAKEMPRQQGREGREGGAGETRGMHEEQGGNERAGGAPTEGTGAGDGPGERAAAARRTPAPEGEFRTDVVDARPKGGERGTGDGTVVGEAIGDGRPGAPGMSVHEVQETIRRARESAERAIDDRTIPGRYDRLLRRYFQRLPSKVDGAKK